MAGGGSNPADQRSLPATGAESHAAALLDVNVLVALFDPPHTNHEDAHRWFGRNRKHGWATCPITINDCIRVLSNPAYLTAEATPAEVAGRLRSLRSTADHHFWADSVSPMDEAFISAVDDRRPPESHGCLPGWPRRSERRQGAPRAT